MCFTKEQELALNFAQLRYSTYRYTPDLTLRETVQRSERSKGIHVMCGIESSHKVPPCGLDIVGKFDKDFLYIH